MAHTLVHFEIPANNPEKLVDFHGALLGWKFEKMAGMDYWSVMTVEEGEQGVNGGMMRRTNPQQTPMNYYEVESIDDFSSKVASMGGAVVMPKQAVPQMGWFGVYLDPDGNSFGLWQTDPSAA